MSMEVSYLEWEEAGGLLRDGVIWSRANILVPNDRLGSDFSSWSLIEGTWASHLTSLV